MLSHRGPGYDDVPFPGLPIAASQPERLATLGRLRGMQVRPAADARMLEVGCAAGQNLLPLAERYPHAVFVGIDNSPRQIETARQAAADAGLTNIDLRVNDIGTLADNLGTFDYIVAHAVYSWVEAPVRDQLLALCKRHLAPQGLAYVSYNTYPGWHIHDMLRAAMLYDARTARSTAEQVGRARALLSFLEASLIESTPYNDLVKAEVAQLLRQDDAYLLHDHLETVNQPVYFRQFARHAGSHGLRVLGDGVLGIRANDRLDPHAEHSLTQLTADPIEREQYRDVVRNRGIRQTILCHAVVELFDQASAEDFGPLFLEASLKPADGEIQFDTDEVQRFVTPSGLRISTGVPSLKAALAHLGKVWPGYLTFDQLVAAALEQTAPAEAPEADARESDRQRLQDNLRQCCYGGVINVHSEPPSFSVRLTERPRASKLARDQAQRGEVATNLKHEAVRLEPLDRQVLQRLDGSLDTAGLVESLCQAAVQGQFVVYERQQLLHDPVQAQRVLGELIPVTLAHLAGCGFLLG